LKDNFLPIDQITKANFTENALDLFYFQYENVKVYGEYCRYLGVTTPKNLKEIPFLPIQFFKSHKILAANCEVQKIFKSSGTTTSNRSEHYIASRALYEQSFLKTFSSQIVNPEEAIIVALLPNYLEQGDSSLVYMVDSLIKLSDHELSGFYLDDLTKINELINKAKQVDRKIVIFGVSFALLDLAEKNINLSETIIIETGGMKGRRKEIIRSELHSILVKGLNVDCIYSEYGMTELLSQAYTDGSEFFDSPAWMKVMIRDINDPLNYRPDQKTGGVNIIDLANRYSCSFIATDDLGVIHNERFKILGRFDQSDIRGCNLLVN
jgi:hypothetical protein